jgi:hypothetical protein
MVLGLLTPTVGSGSGIFHVKFLYIICILSYQRA